MKNDIPPQVGQPMSQTRSFLTVALIELWERFGYYGMQALIVYFMVQRLGFEDSRANLVWGAAAALIYVAPAIGGWIGDKVLGTRRCMVLGALILTLGYALMAVPTTNTWMTFSALGVIVVGNGLFKPNTANLVRKIYEGDDSKIDSAFTIYYMAVNVGSTFSMLATPWIKDHVNATYGGELGWHVAFAVCSVGLGIGLLTVGVLRKTIAHVGSPPDAEPLRVKRLLAVLAGGAGRRPGGGGRIGRHPREPGPGARLRVRGRHRGTRHLRPPDPHQPAERTRRPDGGAGADPADRVLLHLLPADVDLAVAVRAA